MDANVVYETKDMSMEVWLQKRKEGIGGSDAASVLGLNPYKSSLSVYLDKINYEEDNIDLEYDYHYDASKDEEVNYRMELGNKLENFVASEFYLKTGKKVRNVNGILRNDKYSFAYANIDRAVVGEKAFLECKVTNSYYKKLWKKEVPVYYQIQCYHYMAVTGATHCYVAVLIGNEDFVIHRLERNEDMISQIMSLEKEFWEKCVLGNELPTPDGCEDYSEMLKDLYRDSIEEELILFEKDDLINRYDEVRGLLKELDTERKAIEQYLQMQMKEYEIAYLGERKISWKKQERRTFDSKRFRRECPEMAEKFMKTTSSRVFKI